MNSLIQIILLSIVWSIFIYFIWLLIKPKYKDEIPKSIPMMVLEKKEVDLLIKRVVVYLSYEYREESRILIHEQLVVMQNYSNALAGHIDLLRNQ